MNVPAITFIFCLVLAGATLVTRTEANPLALAVCRKISDDQARLKCYDAALEPSGAERDEKPEADAPRSDGWRITEGKSPLDDAPEVTAVLKATTGDAFLVARCKERKTDLLLRPRTFLGSSADSIKVVLRIDGARAVTESWSPSTSGQAAFSLAAIPTLRALPDGGRLFVRAFDLQGAPTDAAFDLGTVSEVRERIRVVCRWPDPKPPKPAIPVPSTAAKP